MTLKRALLLFLSALMIGLVTGTTAVAHHNPGHGGGNPPTATPEPPPPEPCVGCPTLHVELLHVNAWKGQSYTAANCAVRVKDQDGNNVLDALVDVAWSGTHNGAQSGLTVPDGPYSSAWFFTPNKKGKCRNGTVRCFTCTVTNVTKDGYVYDPNANLESTDADDACGPGHGCP